MTKLCSKGADINHQKNFGWSSIMLAAGEGHTDVVKFLAKKGAGLNVQNSDGETALIRAVQFNDKEILDLLIVLGARMDIKDNRGLTAEDWAKDDALKDVIEIAKIKRGFNKVTFGLFR